VGEAGVGKSRLLLELREALRKKEHTYLEGHCLHYGGSMAYLPVQDILRSYFDINEGDREYIVKKKMEERIAQLDGKLSGILPPLQEILSIKVDDEEYSSSSVRVRKEHSSSPSRTSTGSTGYHRSF